VIRQIGLKRHVLLGGMCVEKVSVEGHTGWSMGGGLDTFDIVIPRVLRIFYTCNVDVCLSVDIPI